MLIYGAFVQFVGAIAITPQAVARWGFSAATLLFGIWVGIVAEPYLKRRANGKLNVMWHILWIGAIVTLCVPIILLSTTWKNESHPLLGMHPDSSVDVTLHGHTKWQGRLTALPGALVQVAVNYQNFGNAKAHDVYARIMLPSGLTESARDPFLFTSWESAGWPLWRNPDRPPLASGPVPVFHMPQPIGDYEPGEWGHIIVWVKVPKRPPSDWKGSFVILSEVWSNEESRVTGWGVVYVNGWPARAKGE